MQFYLVLLVVLCLPLTDCVVPAGRAQEAAQSPTAKQAGSEEKVAMGKYPQLEFRKWSGTINVPDPVAVSVDAQGRVYATQTRRRKIQDLDIRANSEWIPDDVGLESVEQKRDFFKRQLAIGGDDPQQAKHVDDVNQDGVHDWRDLTVISEVIYRLVDNDEDGTADEVTVFANDFKTEVTGIAAGVLAFGGDVYATVAPDLWRLRDHDRDGVADSQESIAHGFGLHIAYGGHDMHGPTVGHDGRIYWSIGDKGIHVTTAEGRTFDYPNQGGVMRCNPDGSDFEVFAHGLRNVQEVAFDQYGNMFGVDNDSDQSREKERFVFIVPDMDAGWRCNYQYRGSSYNPWTAERLWELAGEQHAAYIVPPLQHYIDGPAGFKFNPGTALSPDYKDFFFLTGAPNGNQHAFRVASDGDAFKMVDEHQIGAGLAIVGLAFGPDGGLYGADWDGGYPLDEIGSVVRIDVPSANNSPERREVKEQLAAGFDHLDRATLIALLGHADQRLRQGAQFALVDLAASDLLASVAVNDAASLLARLHAMWGLGQLARSGDILARDMVGLMLHAKDEHLRAQAATTYGDIQQADGFALLDLLDDENLHVRTRAGLALGRHPAPQAVEPLLKQADLLTVSQHYLRHSIVSALAACATSDELVAQAQHENELRRMCCVLALRRQAHVAVAEYLHDCSDWVATEAARAIHDDKSIDAALPQLASTLTERDSQSEAFTVRAINANFRQGDAPSAQRVLNFSLAERYSPEMRLIAVQALAEWLAPPLLDRVEGRRRDLASDSRSIDIKTLSSGISSLAAADNQALRSAALAAARKLGIELPNPILVGLANDRTNSAETRIEALHSLAARPAGKRAKNLLSTFDLALKAESTSIQSAAVELIGKVFPQRASKRLAQVVEGDFAVGVKQAAVAALAKLPVQSGAEILLKLGRQLSAGELNSELALDVHEAVTNLPGLAAELTFAPEKFAYARDGGNAKLGEELFSSHVQAQCVRCHKIGSEGSEIGPELTKIAKVRDADYLLRAIAQPSADIDPKYRTQMLVLASGQVIRGAIQSTSETETVVADSTGGLQVVDTDEIESTSEQKISLMPEMLEILTAREVRDLVAYLRSLK